MRWTIKPKPKQEDIEILSNALQVDDLVAQLLLQRGISTYEEAKSFFRPQLSDLHDPFLMKDMDIAVKRIEEAIGNGENILVFGDYDVDGTTAVALLSSYLLSYYPNVATYIPDRYDEGYGVSFKGIDFAEDNGFTLIIALDCGVKAIDKVAYAKEKDIDFIICDHHRPGTILPNAIAILDPKREDCSYPYDQLCGCGVGFKLIQALGSRCGETIDDLVKAYFEAIHQNVNELNVRVVVYNAVPQLERSLAKYLWIKEWEDQDPINRASRGTDEDRRKYTVYMNTKLEEYCETYNYTFFDIYEKYIDEKGYINPIYSDGNCHINDPIFMTEKLKYIINEEHYKLA